MPCVLRRFHLTFTLFAWGAIACETTLNVGTWSGGSESDAAPPTLITPVVDAAMPAVVPDSGVGGMAGAVDSGVTSGSAGAETTCTFPADIDLNDAQDVDWTTPIDVPWSAGFEDGFCDFSSSSGYCLASTDAAYEIVESPVRSGSQAAAFALATQDTLDGTQSRCVRRGVLPEAAYYGAWYFFSDVVQAVANWNLFHFRGGDGAARHGLWDVSLHNGSDGQLYLHVFDQSTGVIYEPPNAPPIPVGEWVHVQFYLRRSADVSGEIALYQDGQLLLQLADIVTDDTLQGAWYVGNLAEELIPAEFTLYLDDVTISDTL